MNLTKYEIAVDFDGTCVKHEYPKIGIDAPFAVDVLRELVAAGSRLILFTMRSGKQLEDAVEWFAKNKIELYGVQQNPTQQKWTSSPKAYAQIYIDDAALGCPLIVPVDDSRPYVDWLEVRQQLVNKNALK